MLTELQIDEIGECDEIIVSGVASSPSGLALDRVPCVVATIAKERDALKVWPLDEAIGDGKVWIYFKDITYFEVTCKDE
jgi:hypothetical protein